MEIEFYSVLFRVSSISATRKFYTDMGFTILEQKGALRIIFGNVRLAFVEVENIGPNASNNSFFFEVEDVDELYEKCRGEYFENINPPENKPWGKRELALTDPDGNKIVFFVKTT